MRFIADAMLGKLTRWLRMLGQDVTYSTGLNDDELLNLSKREAGILLTRDFELYKRAIIRGLDAFFVIGETESTRLAEVAKRYCLELDIDMDNANCPICNTHLKSATKEQLRDKLKENTYRHYEKFWNCPNCGQIYWLGAHWKQINHMLMEAKKQQVNKIKFQKIN